jgi:integrase
MSKSLHRLTVKELDAIPANEARSDGGGLFFRSTGKAQGKWAFKFTSPDLDYRASQAAKGRKSVQREMGLGTYPAVSLAAAREKAAEARTLLAKGIDPLQANRKAEEEAQERAIELKRAASVKAVTFGSYADDVLLPCVLPEFSNPAHIQQWKATFATDAAALREMPLATITRDHVLAVLLPIWSVKNETANRSRQRIERLFAHAIQNGHYKGDNPASWRQFDATLPSPKKQPRHHPAIPHEDIAPFVTAIRLKQKDSMAALLLEWITLSACRTSEARLAVWGEINLERKIWSIPAARMKMRRDHVVPITERMMEVLSDAKKRTRRLPEGQEPEAHSHIFLTERGQPLSEMAALMLMRRMEKFKDYTAHGLRATFKGWAATMTEHPRELIEEQLAHQLGAVERAYMRQSAHERRRPMMEEWSTYCASVGV